MRGLEDLTPSYEDGGRVATCGDLPGHEFHGNQHTGGGGGGGGLKFKENQDKAFEPADHNYDRKSDETMDDYIERLKVLDPATASTTTEPIALMGDVAGHEFHGNQYVDTGGGKSAGKSAEKANDYDTHDLAQDYHISKAMNAGGGKVQDAHDHAAALHEAAKNAATDQYGLPTKNPERFQRLSAKAREASKKAHAVEKS